MSKIKDNTSGLQAILNAVNELPSADTTEYEIYEGSYQVTPSVSSQILDTSNKLMQADVTVNAMPTATQATPSISVSSGGLITAKSTQSAGYVASGTKQATQQLTVQAAQTITPTKSSQTAVVSGRYTTGTITVAAIPSQYITTTDANATTADMRSGKTAYVNGAKITGTIADFDGSYECDNDSTGGSSDGGGGTSIDTCTLTIQNNSSTAYYYVYATTYDSEQGFSAESRDLVSDLIIDSVVCGSCVFIATFEEWSLGYYDGVSINGGFEGKMRCFVIDKDATSATIVISGGSMGPDLPEPI